MLSGLSQALLGSPNPGSTEGAISDSAICQVAAEAVRGLAREPQAPRKPRSCPIPPSAPQALHPSCEHLTKLFLAPLTLVPTRPSSTELCGQGSGQQEAGMGWTAQSQEAGSRKRWVPCEGGVAVSGLGA